MIDSKDEQQSVLPKMKKVECFKVDSSLANDWNLEWKKKWKYIPNRATQREAFPISTLTM
jgi:hypothetical protein